MTQNPYQKASSAYGSRRDDNLTPMQIVVELYKGLLKNIRLAKESYITGKLDVMCDYNKKSFDIIEALQMNLNWEAGGEDTKFLNDFYNITFHKLARVLSVEDTVKEFDSTIAYVTPVYERFYGFAYGKPPAPEDNPENPAATGTISA